MKKTAKGKVSLQLIMDSKLHEEDFAAKFNDENVMDVLLKLRLSDGTWVEVKAFLPELEWYSYKKAE